MDAPLIMGVLNITPDSFSDGGCYVTPDIAVEHALQMESYGADVIDIGAESTRPGAVSISAAEEIDRLLPVIEKLQANSSVKISVDTRKAEVMAAVLSYNPWMINDVEALISPQSLAIVAASSNVQVCLMHMQGQPNTMQHNPDYPRDVVSEVYEYLSDRRNVAINAGIKPENVWLDPGIGFGKNYTHNILLLKNIQKFTELGCRLIVGVSRKSVLGDLLNKPPLERLHAGIAAAVFLWINGATMIRTHDVQQTHEARQFIQAMQVVGRNNDN